MSDYAVRERLTRYKGIGNWTADVYLMFVLRHTDIFPLGDVAIIKSVKKVKRLSHESTTDQISKIAEAWKPYRSIAAYILWHSYLLAKASTFVPAPVFQAYSYLF